MQLIRAVIQLGAQSAQLADAGVQIEVVARRGSLDPESGSKHPQFGGAGT